MNRTGVSTAFVAAAVVAAGLGTYLVKDLVKDLVMNLVMNEVQASDALPRLTIVECFAGRDMLVHVPEHLPPKGARALVVVLHGGMGNALRIASKRPESSALNMDAVADKYGFIVAYLNGTPATRMENLPALAWNAGGGCCGQAAAKNVDDVAYISGAVKYLTQRHGVNPQHVFGTGHSNGAMMTERMLCETDVYAAAVAVSGALNIETARCPFGRGKRLLALHGEDDANVPLAGGMGQGIAKVPFKSQQYTQQVITASGADFRLQLVPGADHKISHINDRIEQTEGLSIAEKAARYFGLAAVP